MILYHVSKDPNLVELTPKIPEDAEREYEDIEIERVCFSGSIDGCLKSIHPEVGVYYAYIPIEYGDDEVYTPSTEEVLDVLYTGEKWIKRPVKVRKTASIIIEDIINTGRKYTLPDNSTIPVFEYIWRYIDTYNDRESKADGYLDYIIK